MGVIGAPRYNDCIVSGSHDVPWELGKCTLDDTLAAGPDN